MASLGERTTVCIEGAERVARGFRVHARRPLQIERQTGGIHPAYGPLSPCTPTGKSRSSQSIWPTKVFYVRDAILAQAIERWRDIERVQEVGLCIYLRAFQSSPCLLPGALARVTEDASYLKSATPNAQCPSCLIPPTTRKKLLDAVILSKQRHPRTLQRRSLPS